MGFPSNIVSCREEIAKQDGKILTLHNIIQNALDVIKKEQKIRELLNGLVESWKMPNPGKDGVAYFFLDTAGKKRVVVKEFLLPSTHICKTQDKWKQYLKTLSAKTKGLLPYEMVSPEYSVVPFAGVAKVACPQCGVAQPLIESYEQIYDSPEWDTWLKERLVFCFKCNTIDILSSEPIDRRC